MNILILGATGFIGSALAARLLAEGHRVTGLGRDTEKARSRFPGIAWTRADIATLRDASVWLPLLAGADVIINAAGALQDGLRDDLKAVLEAMIALYAAAARFPTPPLVIQISAPRDLAASGTVFMDSKLSADRALAASGLPHVILRPTVVIGRNAYGGTALLRALASFPLAVPLVGAGKALNAVHLDDVCDAVSLAIRGEIASGSDLVIGGEETRTLGEMALAYRAWLGLPPAPVVAIPDAVGRFVAGLADLAGLFGWRSPLRSTAMAISGFGVDIRPEAGASRLFSDPFFRLNAEPSGVQDLWFARLYLMKPLLILTLSLFWIISGVVPLFQVTETAAMFGPTLGPGAAMAITILTCAIDILLGLAVLFQPLAARAMMGMLLVSLAYLASGTALQPELWLDPLGPLVKVIPSMLLTVVGLGLIEER